jgi:cellobiose phosphorylase
MTRAYRGATYDIEFSKPAGVQKGKVSLTLDGKKLPDNYIRSDGQGGRHKVKVTIGG